jgi:hypothetical protein
MDESYYLILLYYFINVFIINDMLHFNYNQNTQVPFTDIKTKVLKL